MRIGMRIVLIVLLSVACVALCLAADTKQSLDAFSTLEVKGWMDVNINVGEGANAELSAAPDLAPLVHAVVTAGTMVLDAEQAALPAEKEVTVTSGDFQVIRVLSSGDVHVHGFRGEKLRIEIAGSGDVTVEGSVGSLEVQIAGSGDVDAHDLQAKVADVQVMGSGDVRVYAEEKLRARVLGSGDIHYSGPAEVTKQVLGSGDVIQD